MPGYDSQACAHRRFAPNPEAARVLAYGEKTGHRHVLTDGAVYEAHGPRGQQTFVQLESPARLVHDEHAMIDIPPGVYEVVRQRTYVLLLAASSPAEPPQLICPRT